MVDSKDDSERSRGALLAAVPSAENESATEESSGEKVAEAEPLRTTPASSETSTTPSREVSSASPTPLRVREAETNPQEERPTQKGGDAEHPRQEGCWTRDVETGACGAAGPQESADLQEQKRAPRSAAFSAEELARGVTPRERDVRERDGPGEGGVPRCSGVDSSAVKVEDRENSTAKTPSKESDEPLQRGGSRKRAREMAAAKQVVSSRHCVGDLEDDDDPPDVFMPATSSVARRRQGWPSRLSLQEKLRCLLAAAGGRFRQGLSFTEPRRPAPAGGGEDAGVQRAKCPAHASSPSELRSVAAAKTKEDGKRRRVDETSFGRKAETPSPTDRPVEGALGRQLMSASPGTRRGGAEEETRDLSVLDDGKDGEGGASGARDNSEKQDSRRQRVASADAMSVPSDHEACEEDAFFSLEDCFDEDHNVSLSAVRRDAERLAKYQEALEKILVHPQGVGLGGARSPHAACLPELTTMANLRRHQERKELSVSRDECASLSSPSCELHPDVQKLRKQSPSSLFSSAPCASDPPPSALCSSASESPPVCSVETVSGAVPSETEVSAVWDAAERRVQALRGRLASRLDDLHRKKVLLSHALVFSEDPVLRLALSVASLDVRNVHVVVINPEAAEHAQRLATTFSVDSHIEVFSGVESLFAHWAALKEKCFSFYLSNSDIRGQDSPRNTSAQACHSSAISSSSSPSVGLSGRSGACRGAFLGGSGGTCLSLEAAGGVPKKEEDVQAGRVDERHEKKEASGEPEGSLLPHRDEGSAEKAAAERWCAWAMRRLVEEFWVYVHLHKYRVAIIDDGSHVGHLASAKGVDLLSSFVKNNSCPTCTAILPRRVRTWVTLSSFPPPHLLLSAATPVSCAAARAVWPECWASSEPATETPAADARFRREANKSGKKQKAAESSRKEETPVLAPVSPSTRSGLSAHAALFFSPQCRLLFSPLLSAEVLSLSNTWGVSESLRLRHAVGRAVLRKKTDEATDKEETIDARGSCEGGEPRVREKSEQGELVVRASPAHAAASPRTSFFSPASGADPRGVGEAGLRGRQGRAVESGGEREKSRDTSGEEGEDLVYHVEENGQLAGFLFTTQVILDQDVSFDSFRNAGSHRSVVDGRSPALLLLDEEIPLSEGDLVSLRVRRVLSEVPASEHGDEGAARSAATHIEATGRESRETTERAGARKASGCRAGEEAENSGGKEGERSSVESNEERGESFEAGKQRGAERASEPHASQSRLTSQCTAAPSSSLSVSSFPSSCASSLSSFVERRDFLRPLPRVPAPPAAFAALRLSYEVSGFVLRVSESVSSSAAGPPAPPVTGAEGSLESSGPVSEEVDKCLQSSGQARAFFRVSATLRCLHTKLSASDAALSAAGQFPVFQVAPEEFTLADAAGRSRRLSARRRDGASDPQRSPFSLASSAFASAGVSSASALSTEAAAATAKVGRSAGKKQRREEQSVGPAERCHNQKSGEKQQKSGRKQQKSEEKKQESFVPVSRGQGAGARARRAKVHAGARERMQRGRRVSGEEGEKTSRKTTRVAKRRFVSGEKRPKDEREAKMRQEKTGNSVAAVQKASRRTRAETPHHVSTVSSALKPRRG
ncbi:UNVERIFIED_CONTAM: hypothetical protein HHA_267750 [Hammondia hammondi]|eukprot:XP_008887702.1 hypothetical protein HHA_267750 [Hammondia hammondi]